MTNFHFVPLFVTIIFSICEGIKNDWTYELHDMKFITSKPEVLDPHIQVQRLGRNDFAIFGTVDVNEPITDETFVEMKLERSATGSSAYKVQPYKFPKGNFTIIMNNVYAKYLMPYIKECAPEAPQFETFVPPFTVRHIVVESCRIGTDFLPPHIPTGFYRLSVIFSGQAGTKMEAYVEVEPKY